MNKTVTIISSALAVASFIYMFYSNLFVSCLFGIITALIVCIGFWIESKANVYWNDTFNKMLYYISKNDKKYNIELKEFEYTCSKNNQYSATKKFELYPNCEDLDRMDDSFRWSASSKGSKIEPLIKGHRITEIREEEFSTCYTVYFNETCKKHVLYPVKIQITNLNDSQGDAKPFLSTQIDKKTKKIKLTVKCNEVPHSEKAVFKIVSVKDNREIFSEDLEYDNVVGGFTRSVNYPRKGWKYVIRWKQY